MTAPTAPALWTLQSLRAWCRTYLSQKQVPSANLEADLLMSYAFSLSRLDLYTQFERPITPQELAHFKSLLVRRAVRREPLSYITGAQEFWGLSLRVNPSVLIPRHDTEHLVQAALDILRAREPLSDMRVADIGTGSGAISLALLSELPSLQVFATDLSSSALDTASDNARRLNLAERVTFYLGDLLSPLPSAAFPLDMIISNPPYISTADAPSLAPEVQAHEPHSALFSGVDGLDVIRRLIAQSARNLTAHGWLLLEIGCTQAPATRDLLLQNGFYNVSIAQDYAKLDRVVCAQLTPRP
jgi:release factor glutamine methyltransferase